MRKLYFLAVVLFFSVAHAQEAKSSDLINEGIKYHDRGEYDEAVKYYNMVLYNEPNNELALVEKSYSLNEAKKYQEAIVACTKVIDLKPQNKDFLLMGYLHCGAAYDGLKNEKKSIEMFDKAAKINPRDHLIFFNKGITYLNYGKTKEAEKAFKQSLILSPAHPSSLYRLSYIAFDNGEKIPAILGFCKFLVVEPTSKRSLEISKILLETISSGVKKTENGLSLSIVSPAKGQEDFVGLDGILVMSNSIYKSDDQVIKNQVTDSSAFGILKKQIEMISTSLKNEKHEKKVFYRSHFTSFFSKMGTKEIEVLAHTILAANNDDDSIKWIRTHGGELDDFYNFAENNF